MKRTWAAWYHAAHALSVSKSLRLFQTRIKNAVTFASRGDAKVQAAPVAHLAAQGLARHSISFEVGFAPSNSPLQI